MAEEMTSQLRGAAAATAAVAAAASRVSFNLKGDPDEAHSGLTHRKPPSNAPSPTASPPSSPKPLGGSGGHSVGASVSSPALVAGSLVREGVRASLRTLERTSTTVKGLLDRALVVKGDDDCPNCQKFPVSPPLGGSGGHSVGASVSSPALVAGSLVREGVRASLRTLERTSTTVKGLLDRALVVKGDDDCPNCQKFPVSPPLGGSGGHSVGASVSSPALVAGSLVREGVRASLRTLERTSTTVKGLLDRALVVKGDDDCPNCQKFPVSPPLGGSGGHSVGASVSSPALVAGSLVREGVRASLRTLERTSTTVKGLLDRALVVKGDDDCPNCQKFPVSPPLGGSGGHSVGASVSSPALVAGSLVREGVRASLRTLERTSTTVKGLLDRALVVKGDDDCPNCQKFPVSPPLGGSGGHSVGASVSSPALVAGSLVREGVRASLRTLERTSTTVKGLLDRALVVKGDDDCPNCQKFPVSPPLGGSGGHSVGASVSSPALVAGSLVREGVRASLRTLERTSTTVKGLLDRALVVKGDDDCPNCQKFPVSPPLGGSGGHSVGASVSSPALVAGSLVREGVRASLRTLERTSTTVKGLLDRALVVKGDDDCPNCQKFPVSPPLGGSGGHSVGASVSSPALVAGSLVREGVRASLRTLERTSTTVKGLLDRALVVKGDDDCPNCQKFPVCHEHGSYSLLRYDETPEYMKGNPYVVSGYRPPAFSLAMCLRSLFHLNNETVNIWSHIVGFVIFAYYLVEDNVRTLPSKNAEWMDHVVISLGLICFCICMAMSACFHLFWCISEASCQRWLCLDLLGVTFGILGCYVTGIHYAFYCFQSTHNTYMAIFLALALVTILAPFHGDYALPKYYWHRLFLYILVGTYGVIPTVHWVHQNGGIGSDFSVRFLPSVLTVYGLCALGVCFYILMIPERWMPGWFDLVGWSHQWWHILILSALVWWRAAGIHILDFRMKSDCSLVHPELAG